MTTQIQIRRGTAAQWTAADPILTAGELAAETDTGKFKVGNGTSNWNTLTYSSGAAGAAGSVYLEVKTPENISPADSDTGIGNAPVLTASAYYSLYGIAMAASQWQVSITADFATTVLSTDDVAGTAVTYSMASGLVLANSTYYWRTRYKDAAGTYSDWSAPTTFTTTTSFAPTVIGQVYGGGYYAGKIAQGGVTYYLIVAPKASGEANLAWKTSNTAGPTDTITLNNGPAASASMNSTTYPAAYFCENLTIGGYTDWYAPTRNEVEILYRNFKPTTEASVTNFSRSAYTYPEHNDVVGDSNGVNRSAVPPTTGYTSNAPTQTTVTLFLTGNSEAFNVGMNHTSSEWNASYPWVIYFNNGAQDYDFKTSAHYVRAVRRIAV